jgi:hypothetical protein
MRGGVVVLAGPWWLKEVAMGVKLKVRTSDQSGLAYACVPQHVMWELVEYLAAQRANVLYNYAADGFTVTFQSMGQTAAQRLLDAWVESWIPDPECQEADSRHSRDLFYIPG